MILLLFGQVQNVAFAEVLGYHVSDSQEVDDAVFFELQSQFEDFTGIGVVFEQAGRIYVGFENMAVGSGL